MGRAVFVLLKFCCLAYFFAVCVFFGFFALGLGVVLALANAGLIGNTADLPRFPEVTFFAAATLVFSVGWIVLSVLVDERRWVARVAWILLAMIFAVSTGMVVSGAFATGTWTKHEPTRAGFAWVVFSALLGGLLLVKELRCRGWTPLRRILHQ